MRRQHDALAKVDGDAALLDNVQAQLDDGTGTTYDQLVADARAAMEAEQGLTLRECFRRYPRCIGWSFLLSCAIIMTGYDIVLLGSMYAQPQFQQKYGEQLPDGSYSITAPWQTGLSNAARCGEIVGLTINGYVVDRFGCRKVMMGALALMCGWVAISTFAVNIGMLCAGQVLQGTSWGIFETLTTMYAAEISPVALRPYLTSWVNVCWVIGQLIASGVLRGTLDWSNQWAYRLPFALQWIYPVPILIGCFFAPESPWWCVRNNRLDEARKIIRRLRTNASDKDVEGQLALMMHTNAYEKSLVEGTSYLDCFRSVDRRRTEIACGVWVTQNWSGSAFMNYSTYFLQQAGMATSMAFTLSIVQYAIGIVGTLSSWFLMAAAGRRTLYIGGLITMTSLLVIIGGMGCIDRNNTSAQDVATPARFCKWAIGAMLLVYTAVYDATIGPVCYCLVSEVSSTRLRAKTVAIARVAYNIMGIVGAVVMPYMLNTGELDWGAKTGFFWGGMAFLCLVWTYFRCPEPKGRTYGELDVLFQNRVSARKFASTQADQFAGHGLTRTTSVSAGAAKGQGEKGRVTMRERVREL
ncbi:hypothetical protein JCM8097_006131 [Rhodosporidiobolus ruineniae]